MRILKLTYRLMLVLLCLNLPVVADDGGVESLFSTGAGARALGMGGGFVSLADDASAVFYNPAGLPDLEFHEITFMHMDLFEGTIYDFASWAHPVLGIGGIGVAYMRIGTDDIIERQNFVEVGEFDYSTSQLLISFGRNLEGGYAVGFSAKIVNQKIAEESDYGLGLDFGIRKHFTPKLSLGFTVRDMIPAEIKLKDLEEAVPTSLIFGIGYRGFALSEQTKVTGSFELEKIDERSTKIHTGGEMAFSDAYFIRAGYDRDNFSVGVGFNYRRLKVDYAYKFLDYIEDSHRFSISFLIGSSISEQKSKREEEVLRRGTAMMEDERIRQFAFFKEKADQYYSQFRLDSALVYYQRSLAFDEDNEEIIGTIAAIENAINVRKAQLEKIELTKFEMENLTDNFYQQAVSFFERHLYPAARDMLELIFDINENHLEALELESKIQNAVDNEITDKLEIGKKAENEGRYFEAIEAYTRVLELDPTNQEIKDAKVRIGTRLDLAKQLNMGIEFYRADQYNEARKRFNTVLSIDPKEPVALEYLQKIDASTAQPATLDELQKDKQIWQLYLDGLRYMRNKEYQKAIDAWEKVLEDYPNNVNTLNNIEQARLRLQTEENK